jgi:hypothetical protein
MEHVMLRQRNSATIEHVMLRQRITSSTRNNREIVESSVLCGLVQRLYLKNQNTVESTVCNQQLADSSIRCCQKQSLLVKAWETEKPPIDVSHCIPTPSRDTDVTQQRQNLVNKETRGI